MLIDPVEIMNETNGQKYRAACPIEPLSRSLDHFIGYAHFLRLKVRSIIGELTRHSSDSQATSVCPHPLVFNADSSQFFYSVLLVFRCLFPATSF